MRHSVGVLPVFFKDAIEIGASGEGTLGWMANDFRKQRIGKNGYGDASGSSSTSTIYRSMLGITSTCMVEITQ